MKRFFLSSLIVMLLAAGSAYAQGGAGASGASGVGTAATQEMVNENLKDSTVDNTAVNRPNVTNAKEDAFVKEGGHHIKRRYLFGGAIVVILIVVAALMTRRKKPTQDNVA